MGVLNETAAGGSRFPIHRVGPIPENATGAEADARRVALRVGRAGGRALIVGGYVRDRMLGLDETGEPDLEVFGLTTRQLERVLRPLGRPHRVGRAFPVLRIGALGLEIGLPRRESKTGPGHLGFDAVADPHLSFRAAAQRRDLTLNAMGLDPLTGEFLDPFAGAGDLEAGIMRATDPARFPEDPLRGLRVAAFAARFGFTADEELTRLCAGLDLSELSQERVHDELLKILLSRTPSVGFRFLARSGLVRFLPEVAALAGVPQDPEHHPEGDVFEHTMRVLDQAARRPVDPDTRAAFQFAALCHDFGKPATTRVRENGRITSWGHDAEGARIARGFLERLRAPQAVVGVVEALVRRHLAPALFPRQDAGPGAYRRLARELAAAGATLEMLLELSTADRLGRGTDAARSGRFPEGEAFRMRAEEAGVFRNPAPDAVLGRHLIARNIPPGPGMGRLLERSREIQDRTGETDAERILDQVIHRSGGAE